VGSLHRSKAQKTIVYTKKKSIYKNNNIKINDLTLIGNFCIYTKQKTDDDELLYSVASEHGNAPVHDNPKLERLRDRYDK